MKFSPFNHRPVTPEEAKEGFKQIFEVFENPDNVIEHDFSNLPHIDESDPKIKQMLDRKDLDLR